MISSWWSKFIKLFLRLSLYPREFSYFSWEPFNWSTLFILQRFLVLLGVLPYWKNLFAASPLLLGAFLKYFGLHLRVCCSILKNCSIFVNEISCSWFLYYFHSQCAKKNVKARIPLLGTLCSPFASILGMSLNILRTLKHSPDILHKWL